MFYAYIESGKHLVSQLPAIGVSARQRRLEPNIRQANCLSIVGMHVPFPVLVHIFHKNEYGQWNRHERLVWTLFDS